MSEVVETVETTETPSLEEKVEESSAQDDDELEDAILSELGDLLEKTDSDGILVAILMEALKDPDGFDADRALLTVKAFGGDELIEEARQLLSEEERIAGGGAGMLNDEDVAELLAELDA